ncbi:hypothetical protein FOCC_FOCC012395 [Frankliniella occidentalis]|nr:hypothetical protein FOCC_FOCC012395 [Frankliniella occidentalis]
MAKILKVLLLYVRQKSGRPRLEEDQQGLPDAIMDIAQLGSATDERRRSDVFRSVQTVDQLHEALQRMAIQISRSATYLCSYFQGAAGPWRDSDISSLYRSVETLASLLGPSQCAIISEDDKARLPLGITAAKNQAPILMHLEYKVTLPDHDWVVAPRHKLIPSVYAGIIINEGKIDGDPALVTYSGPTYIAIRSAKHCSSTASSHAFDFNYLCKLPEFEDILKGNIIYWLFSIDGEVKPVIVLSVDGGPDESPRYPKVILHAIEQFQHHNLDALLPCVIDTFSTA